MRHRIITIGGLIPLCAVAAFAWGQAPNRGPRPGRPARPPMLRPALLFQEEWNQHPQQPPPTNADERPPANGGFNVALAADSNDNAQLELESFVPAGELRLVKEGSSENGNNPPHIWTGLCTSPCALALRDKKNFVDLSGLARIRFNTKMSGFHQVRPIVKLADGTWWIGNQAIGTDSDWLESEISFADLHWLKVDMPKVITRGNLVDKIDLSKVDEVGFVDLESGSGHGPGGAADVAQIEVYGRPVPRAGD